MAAKIIKLADRTVRTTKSGKRRIIRSRLQNQMKAMRQAFAKDMGGVIDRIYVGMEDRGWNASWLAFVALISPPTVYNLLNGKTRNPTMRTMKQIALALDVPLDWLLGIGERPLFEYVDPKAVRPRTKSKRARRRR